LGSFAIVPLGLTVDFTPKWDVGGDFVAVAVGGNHGKHRQPVIRVADTSSDIDASSRYEHALIDLDGLYADNVPGLSRGVPNSTSAQAYESACLAVEELLNHGAEPLRIELILAALDAAHDLESAP
jgi:hypothetical protein